ncbi:MAG: twin-arginine translocase subunit TatC [Lawsonibacter sp.]
MSSKTEALSPGQTTKGWEQWRAQFVQWREKVQGEKKMSLVSHLTELRRRLLICACLFLVAFGVCMSQTKWFVDQLIQKASGFSFVYIAPTELVISYLRLALIGGIVITCPVVLYQIWNFIRPGLFKKERVAVFVILTFGVVMFAAGAAFAFIIVLPVMMQFFAQFQDPDIISPMVSIENYLNFVATSLITFGVVFELPVVTVLLTMIGILNPVFLRKQRKYVILIIFIVAAVITPPDIVSQIMVALPMIILFEISTLLCQLLFHRRLKRKEEQETQ